MPRLLPILERLQAFTKSLLSLSLETCSTKPQFSASSASFAQVNHVRFRGQQDFSYIRELLPKKFDLQSSVRAHPLQQYRLDSATISSNICCTIRISCVGYVRRSRARREQCAKHSAPCPRGGAPAILAAEHHREFVGNAAGGVPQCSASAGASFSGFVVTLKRKNDQCAHGN